MTNLQTCLSADCRTQSLQLVLYCQAATWTRCSQRASMRRQACAVCLNRSTAAIFGVSRVHEPCLPQQGQSKALGAGCMNQGRKGKGCGKNSQVMMQMEQSGEEHEVQTVLPPTVVLTHSPAPGHQCIGAVDSLWASSAHEKDSECRHALMAFLV